MIMDDTEQQAPMLSDASEDRHSLNISAFRLLYIYALLSQTEQLAVEDINTHMLNHRLIRRTFTKETLNKYLHTLQLFGCTINRFEEQGHGMFRLEDHPFKLDCTAEELKALRSVANILMQQPLATAYKRYCNLIKRLCRVQNKLDTESSNGLENNVCHGLSPEALEQLEIFQKYCYEGQTLEICYETPEQVTMMTLIEPYEVVSYKRRLYLVGNDPKTNNKVRYEINRIRSHRQLPSRVRTQTVKTQVTFKLTGRVAMNYRPYPGESVMNKGEFLLVKHETDEVDQLLKRLLKYGNHCQVVSPNWARDEMLKKIEHLITAIETPLDLFQTELASKAQTDETLHKWVCYCDNPQTSDDEAAD